MLGIKIISDNNKKSKKIKKNLISQIKKQNYSNQKIIIVIGGDGFMLETLKKIRNQINFFMELIQETMVF